MIKYFNTGYVSRYVLVIIIAIIIWIPSLIIPENYSGVTSYAYGIILELLGNSTLAITLISLFLTLFTALLLNLYAINSGIVGKVSTLAFALFVIFSSTLTGEFHNNPAIWINFILVFVWMNLMQLPYKLNTIPIIFNASFLVGVASLFYSQLVFLFILIWMAIFIHRIVTWRNLVVTLIGVTIPYFFLLTWFYFTEMLLEESYVLFNSLKFDFFLLYPTDLLNITVLAIVVPFLIITVLGVIGRLNENSINRRRNLLITVVYFFIILLILIVFSKSLNNLLLLAIPSVLLISYWVSNQKYTKWYNITLSVLLLIIIVNQYLPLVYYWLDI